MKCLEMCNKRLVLQGRGFKHNIIVNGPSCRGLHNILCSSGILVIKQPAPRRILGGGGIYNFKARFKWAILKIKAKMTLLQFFGHISLS